MKKHTILAVDDNKTNLQVIKDILEEKYTVLLALNGEMALKFVEKKKPDLILLDLLMPEMDGREIFAAIKKKMGKDTMPVIFLTADQNENAEADCLKLGASDFITKPIVPEVLLRRIERTIELEEFQKNLQEKIEEKTREVEAVALQAIAAIANTIDAKDEDTNGHSRRVAYYSRAIAARMGYDQNTVAQIYQTALLHDVGKIGVPDAVLKKAGKLTEEEYAQIKEHTNIGADILSAISTIDYIADGARYHHERYDGSGYPKGLVGEEIPVIGRIIAVADVYDALTSRRCYKKEMDQEVVKQEIIKGAGTQFDPDVVKVFAQLLDEGIGKISEASLNEIV